MSTKSNLYAEKIFSEHPIGLWNLDDNADYVSLILENQRDVSSWDFSNATITTSSEIFKQPFLNSITNEITFDSFAGPSKEIEFIGPNLTYLNGLNFDSETVTVGGYFYFDSSYFLSASIGFEYTDTSSLEINQRYREYTSLIPNTWNFISHTFGFPNQETYIRPIIKIKFQGGAVSNESYKIFANGITVGQESENFNAYSLGQTPISLPEELSALDSETSSIDCLPLKSYAQVSNDGYYFIQNKTFLSKNSGIPMVYGSDSITKILYRDDERPSMVIPGQGFLNSSGKYSQYTFETWLRIDADTSANTKIFGTASISYPFGLWINDGFITLKIGDFYGSHYVGEWYRPMLVHISYSPIGASLLINGERVIDLKFNIDDLKTYLLPGKNDENNYQLDWLGFFNNDETITYEIDCPAIYPYLISDVVAKKRFVYGQGVSSTPAVNSSKGETTAYIDYAFSEYTSNYNYPNIGSWQQGQSDNVVSQNKALSLRECKLPDFNLDGFSYAKLKSDNMQFNLMDNWSYLTFRSTSSWNNKKTGIYFNKFSNIFDDVAGVSMIVSVDNFIEDSQTLFHIYNKVNNNYFKVVLDNSTVKYIFKFNNIVETLYEEEVEEAQPFCVGFNINKLVDSYNSNIISFFGMKNNLELYVASNNNILENFQGRIYNFNFYSKYNISFIKSYFLDNGISNISKTDNFFEYTATYSLLIKDGEPIISSSGYWEDYIPLSYFGSYKKNADGEQYYHLDFLQLNIDYPAPTKIYSLENTTQWIYDDIELQYDHPIQQQYAQFDNALFSGWDNYEDVEQKSVKTYFYDTQNAYLESYISFQYIADGSNKNLDSFDEEISLNNSKIIDLTGITDWKNKLYEVCDNVIIYPPSNVDFNDLSIVLHLKFKVKDAINNKIAIKKIEICSQTYDDLQGTKIGTRFGSPLYPYKKSGIYYDYISKNPISISKESVPYLYLTKKTGIEVRGTFNELSSRGVTMPLNINKSLDYSLSALQMFTRYQFDKLPYRPLQLFEIEYKGDAIQIFINAINQKGTRGKIFAKYKNSSKKVNGLAFYINGNLTSNPVLEIKEWIVLGISFANPLNMASFIGHINLNGPFIYNDISTYSATELQKIQSKIYRKWLKVKNDGIDDIYWSYWNNSFIWDGVLVLSTSSLYGVDPSKLYETYIGKNKVVVEDASEKTMTLRHTAIRIFEDVSWQSNIFSPL